MDIFVDWGSSNFRAFLMKGNGIIDRRDVAGQGILKSFSLIPPAARVEEYSWFLFQSLGNWLNKYPDAPVIMCGAIGSREGWIETGYVEAPVSFRQLAQKARRVKKEEWGRLKNRRMFIVPGTAIAYKDGRHDVMRSEETKALGAATFLEIPDALLCIPGTHSKWVEVQGERIISFHTAMTGEIYQLMHEYGALSTLFRPMPVAEQDNDAFDQGVALAEAGGDLLSDLWQVRSRKLRDENPPQLHSFFSGILLGHEMRQMSAIYGKTPQVVLVSDTGVRQRFYRRALERFGWTVRAKVNNEQAVCTGLYRIRQLL